MGHIKIYCIYFILNLTQSRCSKHSVFGNSYSIGTETAYDSAFLLPILSPLGSKNLPNIIAQIRVFSLVLSNCCHSINPGLKMDRTRFKIIMRIRN
jgi:hypothetical protein